MEHEGFAKLIKYKNDTLHSKEERIRLLQDFGINWRLQSIAKNANEKPIAVIVRTNNHYTVALCYKGNIIQADAANDTKYRLSKEIPMLDTCTKNRGMQNDNQSCATFALQMAEDLVDYYYRYPIDFPKQREGMVTIPQEVRRKWAVYTQSEEVVSKLTQDFSDGEKHLVELERRKFPLDFFIPNGYGGYDRTEKTYNGWAAQQTEKNDALIKFLTECKWKPPTVHRWL